MEIRGIKSGFAFTRNPIVLRSGADEWDDIVIENVHTSGTFIIKIDGSQVYKGRFFPPLELDISEIVDAAVSFFKEPTGAEPLELLYEVSDGMPPLVEVGAEFDGMRRNCDFSAVPGGVSKQNYRRMLAGETDIFETRFLNPENNFFLTTRTAGWRIVMKETEIFPLYMLYFFKRSEKLSVVETTGGNSLTFLNLDHGVYAVNIDQLRRRFMEEHNVIPSVFDIYTDDRFSCRIVLEQSDICKERYRLKFRNSLGVFEIIELTGELSITPEYEEGDEVQFKRFDSVTGDFNKERERMECAQTITIETGVKRPDEIRFLMDMLGSEEVYLLDLGSSPVRVIPSVKGMTYKPRPEEPQKFTLSLAVAESETNIMQDIIDGTEGRRPRVFTKQFSKQFN